MRTTATLAFVLGLLHGCRAASPQTSAELEAALQRDARSVVRDEDLALWSPYDEAATEGYALVAHHEARLVRELLGAPGAPPVRLYLVETHEEREAWESAAREGVGGGAFPDGFAFAYVPAAWTPFAAGLEREKLRHELAHLYAGRAGLTRGKWFNEGLARTIETMSETGGALREHPFPPALVAARAAVGPGSLARLLAWTKAERLGADALAPRYDHSQTLLRFLLERAPGARWLDRLRHVHELEEHELLALEPDWLAWLADLDPLAAVREGALSAEESERAHAAFLLPILAERGAAELVTRGADDLALELLADPAGYPGAVTFLLFFRARELDASDLATLDGSGDPTRLLAAQALRARRGEPVDLDAARAVWRGLGKLDRARCNVPARFLPGLAD